MAERNEIARQLMTEPFIGQVMNLGGFGLKASLTEIVISSHRLAADLEPRGAIQVLVVKLPAFFPLKLPGSLGGLLLPLKLSLSRLEVSLPQTLIEWNCFQDLLGGERILLDHGR